MRTSVRFPAGFCRICNRNGSASNKQCKLQGSEQKLEQPRTETIQYYMKHPTSWPYSVRTKNNTAKKSLIRARGQTVLLQFERDLDIPFQSNVTNFSQRDEASTTLMSGSAIVLEANQLFSVHASVSMTGEYSCPELHVRTCKTSPSNTQDRTSEGHPQSLPHARYGFCNNWYCVSKVAAGVFYYYIAEKLPCFCSSRFESAVQMI